MKHRQKNRKKKFGQYYLTRFGITALVLLGVGGKHVYNLWTELKDSEATLSHDLSEYDVESLRDRLEEDDNIDLGYELAQLTDCTPGSGKEYGAVFVNPETGAFRIAEPRAYAVVFEGEERKTYCQTDKNILDQIAKSECCMYHKPIVDAVYIRSEDAENDGQSDFFPTEVFVPETKLSDELMNELYWMQNPIAEAVYDLLSDGQRKGEWLMITPEAPEGYQKISGTASKNEMMKKRYYPYGWTARNENGETRFAAVTFTGSPASPHIDSVMETFSEWYPSRHLMKEEQIDALENGEDREYVTQEEMESYGASAWDEYAELKIQDIRESFDNTPIFVLTESGYEFDDSDNEVYRCKAVKVHFQGEKCQILFCAYKDLPRIFRYYYAGPIMLQLIVWLPCAALLALLWAAVGYAICSRRFAGNAHRAPALSDELAGQLKTQLAGIIGCADSLLAHTQPEDADTYAQSIRDHAQNMDEMLSDLLGTAGPEIDQHAEKNDTVDLAALLHAAFAGSSVEMALRGVTLKESGTLTVKGNAEMLKQLAEALAANAVQHTAEGGKITVTAEKKTLCISNPFTGELDESTLCDPAANGGGHGLHTVQQICELHKIRFSVTARDGVFTVTLRA